MTLATQTLRKRRWTPLRIALVVGAAIAVFVIAGAAYLKHAISEVHVEVQGVSFSLDSKAPNRGGLLGQLARVTSSEVIIDSELDVKNPLMLSADLEEVSWRILVGGADVGGGRTEPGKPQRIAAGKHSAVALRARVPLAKIAQLALRARGRDVKIVGTARVAVLGFSVEQDFVTDATRVLKGGSLGDILSRYETSTASGH